MLKKICLRCFMLLVLLIVVDLIVGSVAKKIYFLQKRGASYKTTYVMEKATNEIMILGSSKVAHHYIASLMTDSLKYTCYNGGRDGSFISYSNALLNSMLTRYTPKLVIVDILDDEFEEQSYKLEDKLSALLPYYRNHVEIKSIVDLKSPYEKYKLISGMYTYNSLLLPSITSVMNIGNKDNYDKNLGYIPIPMNEVWQGEIKVENSHGALLNNNKIEGLRNIIKISSEKRIKLIIVVSPTYKKYTDNFSPTIDIIKKMTDASKVPFWNYLYDTTYLNNRIYFKDIRHLNDRGAKIFTQNIIHRLKNSVGILPNRLSK